MQIMKKLEEKLEVIKALTKKDNIIINYASCYGGYQLCHLLDGGAQRDICVRMPRKEFVRYLDGMIEGLTIGRV